MILSWARKLLNIALAGGATVATLGGMAKASAADFSTVLEWSWTSSTTLPDYLNVMNTPSAIDLTGDGIPEVVFGATNSRGGGGVESGVLRALRGNNGSELFTVTDPTLRINTASSIATGDIDGDGFPEIIANDASGTQLLAFESNGSFKWRSPVLQAVNWGAPAIAADPEAEIVLVNGGLVWLLEPDLSVIWGGVSLPGGGVGGPPTIADFDNDGAPEIGVAGATRYAVFETDGTLKWQTVTQDSSSNRTGSSVFDFEGDGAAEVIYGDELKLRVYRGSDGFTLFETPKSSCTWYEYPFVADVDGDNSAEIVAVANNNCGFGPQRGIFVYGSANDDWIETRRIWNQHTYHITNVLPDGTIPTEETPTNWLATNPHLNNFRLNQYGPGEGPISVPEPASILSILVLGTLGAASTLKRQLKSSKSSEKETTKVS